MYAFVRQQVLQAYLYILLPWRTFFPAIRHALHRLIYFRATTGSLSQFIHFTPQTYTEVKLEKGVEPHIRHLRFVYLSPPDKWHIKVTFSGRLQTAPNSFADYQTRKADLMKLCLDIDLDTISLLRDTVTELLIMCKQDTNVPQLWQQIPFKKQSARDAESEYTRPLWLHIREDPSRVRFPLYNEIGMPTQDLTAICKIQELSMGVHEVRVGNNLHVYKEVDRPMYEPRDSEVLEQELRNLKLGIDGVVKLVASVVSSNPYHTRETTYTTIVLQGILLEYHPNGTLQDMLRSTKECLLWHRWAIQITSTLHRLHKKNITHMDLKPANIVISKNLDAILIDIGGIGGTTRDWLSPEMKTLIKPLSEEFELRKQNDIWAMGKVLSAMADATHNMGEKQILKEVSLKATTERLPRISLSNILLKLKAIHKKADQSTSTASNPPS